MNEEYLDPATVDLGPGDAIDADELLGLGEADQLAVLSMMDQRQLGCICDQLAGDLGAAKATGKVRPPGHAIVGGKLRRKRVPMRKAGRRGMRGLGALGVNAPTSCTPAELNTCRTNLKASADKVTALKKQLDDQGKTLTAANAKVTTLTAQLKKAQENVKHFGQKNAATAAAAQTAARATAAQLAQAVQQRDAAAAAATAAQQRAAAAQSVPLPSSSIAPAPVVVQGYATTVPGGIPTTDTPGGALDAPAGDYSTDSYDPGFYDDSASVANIDDYGYGDGDVEAYGALDDYGVYGMGRAAELGEFNIDAFFSNAGKFVTGAANTAGQIIGSIAALKSKPNLVQVAPAPSPAIAPAPQPRPKPPAQQFNVAGLAITPAVAIGVAGLAIMLLRRGRR